MYFWNIDKLKEDMKAQPLSEAEVLPYVLAYVSLTTVVTYISTGPFDMWRALEALGALVIAPLGTIHIYRENGGAEGRHFLQRYMAVGFVVALRWTVFIIAAYTAFAATGGATFGNDDDGKLAQLLLNVVLQCLLYWRIGHHVADVAEHAGR